MTTLQITENFASIIKDHGIEALRVGATQYSVSAAVESQDDADRLSSALCAAGLDQVRVRARADCFLVNGRIR